MLKMVQSLFAAKANPIGIDFGGETLRMAQVQLFDGEYRLTAAASASIPSSVRKDSGARLKFLADACKAAYARGNFSGKQAMIGMPSSMMHVQHLRLPKMDDESLRKALPWEARGKIAIEPSQAILRHFVAGEIFQDQETKLEVILMAVERETVDQLIRIAEMSRLDVIGLTPEPQALLECFRGLFKKKNPEVGTTMYIDIGFSGTRVIVAHDISILFARFIPIGGDQFNYAASVALKIPAHEARKRRIQLAETSGNDPKSGTAVDVISEPLTAKRMAERGLINEACKDPLDRLVTELELCRNYHEATFPNRPIDRIVFVGGESMQRSLCQKIAKSLGIAAQLGDPMVRLGRTSQISADSGLDVLSPQPAWAVAIGLSIGSQK